MTLRPPLMGTHTVETVSAWRAICANFFPEQASLNAGFAIDTVGEVELLRLTDDSFDVGKRDTSFEERRAIARALMPDSFIRPCLNRYDND